jgi:glycosyltransferase involved in cell wall biosynthesis
MVGLGQIPRSETPELYRNADLFVLPTLSDGFGLTQLEALAHGLPVVATPNCARVVEDGVQGRIVPAADSQALAHAILSFADCPDRSWDMADACRARAGEFSADVYAKTLFAALPQSREQLERMSTDGW